MAVDNGVSKMDTIVCERLFTFAPPSTSITGEIVEKSTRVLTEEEKKVLDQDFVGKNGEKRKIEVGSASLCVPNTYSLQSLVHHGSTKAQEVSQIRDQVEGFGPQIQYMAATRGVARKGVHKDCSAV